jgi:hypothetical protein
MSTFTPFAFVKQPSYVTSNLVLNLMAYDANSYPGTGSVITDLSGNNLTGRISGSVSFNSTGYLNFNGSTNYIYVNDNSLLTLGTAYTLDNYIWVDNYVERWRIVDKWVTTAGGQGYTFSTQVTNGRLFSYVNAAFAGNDLSPNPIGTGAWKQAVLVRNGNSTIFYINGAEFWNTTTNTTAATIDTSVNLFFGYNPINLEYGEGRWAHGRIYNRALTAAEVLQNYNALPFY